MSSRRALVLAAVVVVFGSLYVNVFLKRSHATLQRRPLSEFPGKIGNWAGTDESFPNRILENLGVDDYLMRRFTDGTGVISLYIGYYMRQGEGTSPHSPRHCYPGTGWAPLKNDVASIAVDVPGKSPIRVNRYVFGKGSDRECVIYWYQSRGRVVHDEYVALAYKIADALFRNRSDGALVRLSQRSAAGNEDAAMKEVEEFAGRIFPHMARHVPD